MLAVNHLPIGIVAHDGRAAQALENAHLNFLRPERDETVKTSGKTFQRFTRQADDQIRVYVHAGLAAQKMEVVFQAIVILAAFNQRAITVYQRAGFVPVSTFKRSMRQGPVEFLAMSCPAL